MVVSELKDYHASGSPKARRGGVQAPSLNEKCPTETPENSKEVMEGKEGFEAQPGGGEADQPGGGEAEPPSSAPPPEVPEAAGPVSSGERSAPSYVAVLEQDAQADLRANERASLHATHAKALSQAAWADFGKHVLVAAKLALRCKERDPSTPSGSRELVLQSSMPSSRGPVGSRAPTRAPPPASALLSTETHTLQAQIARDAVEKASFKLAMAEVEGEDGAVLATLASVMGEIQAFCEGEQPEFDSLEAMDHSMPTVSRFDEDWHPIEAERPSHLGLTLAALGHSQAYGMREMESSCITLPASQMPRSRFEACGEHGQYVYGAPQLADLMGSGALKDRLTRGDGLIQEAQQRLKARMVPRGPFSKHYTPFGGGAPPAPCAYRHRPVLQ